jgi:four helix bundle protein
VCTREYRPKPIGPRRTVAPARLNAKVFEMTSKPPSVHDFKFRDNIRDAADSAERNFPEGFGKFAPAEFARFLDHSRASLPRNEERTRCWTAARLLHRSRSSRSHPPRQSRWAPSQGCRNIYAPPKPAKTRNGQETDTSQTRSLLYWMVSILNRRMTNRPTNEPESNPRTHEPFSSSIRSSLFA